MTTNNLRESLRDLLGVDHGELVWQIIERREDKEKIIEELKEIKDEKQLRIKIARILVSNF